VTKMQFESSRAVKEGTHSERQISEDVNLAMRTQII
jgi:hypothetical protein